VPPVGIGLNRNAGARRSIRRALRDHRAAKEGSGGPPGHRQSALVLEVPGSPGTPPNVTLAYNEASNRITTGQYTYDSNGNIVDMPGVTRIQWDAFDRMIQATANSTTTNYKYDAFGRRVARVTPSGTDTFFYDMSGRLLAQHNGGWTPYKYVYFAGQKLGQYTDRLGSVRYANSGGVVSHYYPYGELVAGTNNTGFKFAETYRDDTGLDYAMARYYNSGIGRFLSVDSGRTFASHPQSFNRYAYASNDPANFVDPGGLEAMFAMAGGIWTSQSEYSLQAYAGYVKRVTDVQDANYGNYLIDEYGGGSAEVASWAETHPEISLVGAGGASGAITETVTSGSNFLQQAGPVAIPAPGMAAGAAVAAKALWSVVGGPIAVGVLVAGAVAVVGYEIYKSNKAANKTFGDAVREYERECGSLDDNQRRRLHEFVHGQDFGYHDIVEAAKTLFGCSKNED